MSWSYGLYLQQKQMLNSHAAKALWFAVLGDRESFTYQVRCVNWMFESMGLETRIQE